MDSQIELRPYQAAVVESALQALTSHGSAVLQMPTGAGKTKAAISIIDQYRRKQKTVWFICHRQEIERQVAAALSYAGIDYGTISPRAKPDYSKAVQIVSVGTLARRIADLELPALAIWDECHHVAAKSWAKIRERLNEAQNLGLTATPERLDGKGLSEWFAALVTGPTTRELIDGGWLSDFRYFAPSEPDLTVARLQAGDYRKDDVAKAMNMPVLIGDAIAEYNKNAAGKRALVFCASVEASRALVDRFNAAGVAARHVDGATPTDERDESVRMLASGEIQVLSNVEVFTEGFDLPAIDVVILLRPTKSLALYLQMIGRALRKAAGKGEALIFDHAGLWLDHGWIEWPIKWSLNGGAQKRRVDGRMLAGRRCPVCKRVYGNHVIRCDCGYIFSDGRNVEEFDGFLSEVKRRPPPGYVTRFQFRKIFAKIVRRSAWIELERTRKYGDLVCVKEEMEHLRAANYPFLPPIFSSRRNEYIDPGYQFDKKYKINVHLAEAILKRPLRKHANGWIDMRDADSAILSIRHEHMPLSEFNRILGKWRTERHRTNTSDKSALPVINEELANGRYRHGTPWVHIQRGLEWVRDNTDIAIPPEAWPSDAPSALAEAA